MARVRLFAALLFVIPLAASATIYQWTDEQGHVVFGNQVPEAGARNVRAVMKEDPASARSNRELEERIARLERQVQTMALPPAPAPYPVAPAPYPAAPPPMAAGYYGTRRRPITRTATPILSPWSRSRGRCASHRGHSFRSTTPRSTGASRREFPRRHRFFVGP
ncbi:MAG: DUF4124 domain-containing protein [Betaproteobacteria bacterium]|nr:MAG: DUF4124 domain-containing protein [Betaproteobacteria bacterium]